MKTLTEIENLIAEARPLSEEDYDSERQVNLENEVYSYLESVLSKDQYEAFSNYCSKATIDECLDAALYTVNGHLDWLNQWK